MNNLFNILLQPAYHGSMIEDDLEIIRENEPGSDFLMKAPKLPRCRVYRPIALAIVVFLASSVIFAVFIYAIWTGEHINICNDWKRENLMIITWAVIAGALLIGTFGFVIIFCIPTSSCVMNRCLVKTDIDNCKIKEGEVNKILGGCAEQLNLLELGLAGSASDRFACFFGQNHNIGLKRNCDYIQDLDLNIIYPKKDIAVSSYSIRKADKNGYAYIKTEDTSDPLSSFLEGNNLSRDKILKKMKDALSKDKNLDIKRITPAIRVKKRDKKNEGTIYQYDSVFCIAANNIRTPE